MVLTYKRTTDQHSWSMEGIKKAILRVVLGEMSYKKAASLHNVPQTTLKQYFCKYPANPDDMYVSQEIGPYVTNVTNLTGSRANNVSSS